MRTQIVTILAAVTVASSAMLVSCSRKPSGPEPSWTVEGTVDHGLLQPAVNASVYLTERMFPLQEDDPYIATAETDADGRFRFSDIQPGSYGLHAVDANDSLVAGFAFTIGAPGPGGSTLVAPMQLQQPCSVTGTAQIQGATDHRDIYLSIDGMVTLLTPTDSLGQYRIEGIPAGIWTVIATFVTFPATYAPDTATVVLAAPGDSARQDFVLQPVTAPNATNTRRAARAARLAAARRAAVRPARRGN